MNAFFSGLFVVFHGADSHFGATSNFDAVAHDFVRFTHLAPLILRDTHLPRMATEIIHYISVCDHSPVRTCPKMDPHSGVS